LVKHTWPGNVRELENVVERAVVLAEGNILLPEHLPPEIGMQPEILQGENTFSGYSLKEAQKAIEERLIIKALKDTGGNRTQSAKLLEISHPSLLSKMKAYGIDL
jgi:two-component system response regulator AtoC